MAEYVPTIGLEVHAELKTRTKMFCASKNDAAERKPNLNICPVCLAHPGTLPTVNREAVRYVLKVGLAVGGTLADYTEFDRKNYFYPDLPKGYQISQYEYPLVSGGVLHDVALTRIHLEEDTASSMHDEETGTTTIDYNRAGVPLLELVTEPVMHSAEEAGSFARELQLLLRQLGVSDANMEKGEMRVEANVSLAPEREEMGTKVEIKNLNSFRAMERAVAYEIERQTALLEEARPIIQETRGWDEAQQTTFSQRTKEGSADYRYFPDPDLPSLKLSEVPEFALESLKEGLPELSWERRARYRELGIKSEDAAMLVAWPQLAGLLDQVLVAEPAVSPQLAANYITNDVVNVIRDAENPDTEIRADIPISAGNLAKILAMAGGKKISSRVAKDLLVECCKTGDDPETIVAKRQLFSVGNAGELEKLADAVLAQNEHVVDDYKVGNTNALEYLVGQGMRKAKGAADPTALRELILRKLG